MAKKTVNMNKLGKQIKLTRISFGLSQEQLSEKAGITEKYLSKIETGNGNCSLSVIFEIANALKVGLDHLFGEQLACNKTINTSDDYLLQTILHESADLTKNQKEFVIDGINSLKKHELK